MEPGPTAQWQSPRRSKWAVLGIVLAVLLAIGGLVIVGMMVLFIVAMNQYGNNK